MNRRFAIICLWCGYDLILSLIISGLFPFYGSTFYWFTVPYILNVAMAFLVAVRAVFLKTERSQKFALYLFGSLPISWIFAMFKWPGGDDGSGGAWCLLVGSASFLGLAFAIWTLFQMDLEARKQRRIEEQNAI